ncbi:alpha/beta fold hydrolase [Conexibacter woesei]|uniref:Alpha/beta hydrolase fold protein n=1 Tax=Conexibacter woesei (strain DSM 14684 / CCUG 47730 / CIP 108061 / JCM 11494 / NBRC 100937 / ID131577) TaxID=469383 RepID=D3F7F9_CONWI|nr:alpha/beta hydrolase [Conexibacter woesei]ADB50821.1 alpha/beta hydrolase fold protein [Conexibacter woesei DSM 14684]
MEVARGELGRYPFAAVGTGDPVVVLAGLSPVTGVGGDGTVRASLAPLAGLARRRRLVLLNRRSRLPRGMTMAQLAAEHAEAIRAGLAAPVDVLGSSTGGSIAQQLAADHPDVVRRLVLISSACRLGPHGRRAQRQVAARIRAGARRRAFAVMAADLVPPRRGQVALGALGWLLGPALVRDPRELDDMATTIEAEDAFDLAACRTPIAARTLIVAGRDDRFYSPALFEETARLIPRSELHVIPGRGHVTVTRDRRLRGEALGAFLA